MSRNNSQISVLFIGKKTARMWFKSLVAASNLTITYQDYFPDKVEQDVVMVWVDSAAIPPLLPYEHKPPLIVVTNNNSSHFKQKMLASGAHACHLHTHLTPYWLQQILETAVHAAHKEQYLVSNLQHIQAIYATTQFLVTFEGLQKVLQQVTNDAMNLLDSDNSVLFMLDIEKEEIVHQTAGAPDDPYKPSYDELMDGLTGWVVRERKPTISYKSGPDKRESEFVAYRRKNQNVGSMMVAPIMFRDEVLGTLSIAKTVEKPDFRQDDLRMLITFSHHAALAIKTASLFETMQRRANNLAVLADLSSHLRQTSDIKVMLKDTLEHGLQFIDGHGGAIFLQEKETNDLVLQISYPDEIESGSVRHTVNDTSITSYVFRSGKCHMSEELHTDPIAYIKPNESHVLKNTHSHISLPLRAKNKIVGVIHFNSNTRQKFDADQLNLLATMADIAGSALQQIRLYDELEGRVQARTKDLEQKNSELATAIEQLQEVDRIKGKFVSDMSHELRTPITALGLHLDLLERGRPEKRGHYLKTVRYEVDRLRDLVLDVLKLSRFDLGRVQVAFSEVDLNSLITHEVKIYRESAEATGLALRVELGQDVPLMWGEAMQLSEMISNLIKNAVSYTAQGFIRVSTHYDTLHDMLCLEIEDSGLGIQVSEFEEIFGRFYRGNSSHGIPGSGLGLNLVQQIASLHGGTVTVESTVGVGSTFRVTLPRMYEPNLA